jgi:alpha-N-arabinofuranosidase
VGRDFYLATSSFEYFPGVPLFHSRDLVNWRPIGHALTRKRQLDLTGIGSSRGIYAPTLRHDGERFYLVTTLIDGGGNFMVTARRASGPWSDPIWIDREGIDPSLTFDGGRVFYTRNGKGTDFDHPFIHQAEIDPRTGRLRGPLRVIWRGLGGIWPEGPHLYALHGRYYLMAAEGGTSYGHAEMIGRADDPFGPFEPGPRNPILSHRDRRGHPIQALGHADLVTLPGGEVWAVFLGIRPTGGRHHHLGRETFLAPVRFDRAGWPMIGARGRVELRMIGPPLRRRPSPSSSPPARDDFTASALGREWMFLRNPPAGAISLGARRGHLRLAGTPATLDDVAPLAFVGRRQRHFAMRFRARLDFAPRRPGDEAGLTVRAREEVHAEIAVRLGDGGREAVALARTGGGKTRVLGRVSLQPGPLELEIAASETAYELAVGAGRRRRVLGRLPTSAFSAETIARRGTLHFTGAVLGMYATGRGRPAGVPADFDWCEYRALP